MGNRKINSFTDIYAWQEGQKLVLMIYQITKSFPKDEQFALTSQIRRAVISITSNVAEGYSRESFKDKIHFYAIARGSVTEVQSQLYAAKDLKYITSTDFEKTYYQSTITHKLLSSLIKSSKSRI